MAAVPIHTVAAIIAAVVSAKWLTAVKTKGVPMSNAAEAFASTVAYCHIWGDES